MSRWDSGFLELYCSANGSPLWLSIRLERGLSCTACTYTLSAAIERVEPPRTRDSATLDPMDIMNALNEDRQIGNEKLLPSCPTAVRGRRLRSIECSGHT